WSLCHQCFFLMTSMGVFLYSVETSWPEMCLMALRLSGLRCVVGLIRHLCRHPAQARGIT
ncbi:hypothetical protein AH286_22980, partial [Salmonella enterica subsp. enterica]|nr:hypothetical protein [Salmonella enterica subsp. enterica]